MSQPESPHVMYAYIESQNERSRNLINQAGYEYIRSFLTVAFSRFNPRSDPSVTLLAPEKSRRCHACSQDNMLITVSTQMSSHSTGHRYYVMRKDNEIVAGVCAIPAEYRVVNVPGLWGWMMMKVLPATPLFRRLFRPGRVQVSDSECNLLPQGHEDLLPDLFEAVCAEEGYHTALTWLDDHSELYRDSENKQKDG